MFAPRWACFGRTKNTGTRGAKRSERPFLERTRRPSKGERTAYHNTMKKEYICMSCGSRNAPERITKGSLNTELALWSLLFLPVLLRWFWNMPAGFWLFALPGPIYMSWRLITRTYVCRKCSGNAARLSTSQGEKTTPYDRR